MNIYLLLKLFIKFNDSIESRFRQSSQSNLIIYARNFQTGRYREFFHLIGFKMKNIQAILRNEMMEKIL
jgi:hypothetical protein